MAPAKSPVRSGPACPRLPAMIDPAFPTRLLVTGGTGVLGRALIPEAREAGLEVLAPGRGELDLFAPAAVSLAVRRVDAVLPLATRIPPLDKLDDLEAWRENDRLRAIASAILVGASLA